MAWEYMTVEVSKLKDGDLDTFGAEGWELVSVVNVTPAAPHAPLRLLYAFKRPLQDRRAKTF